MDVDGSAGVPYRNIIFDLDGTLIDSRPGIHGSLRHALVRLGHEPPEGLDLGWAIGPPLEEVMARLLASFGDERWPQAVAAYREHYASAGLFDARPYDGIPELMAELAAGGRALAVGTAKRTAFARTVLRHFRLAGHFAAICGAETRGGVECKSDIIRRALAEGRFDPAETVLVGDREHDVEAARANAVAIVAVTYGYGHREELSAAGATLFCDAPGDLRGLL